VLVTLPDRRACAVRAVLCPPLAGLTSTDMGSDAVGCAYGPRLGLAMDLETTTALLDDLRDPGNGEVWGLFDARYRPVLIAFGRRFGLTRDDAADAAQETLLRFVQSYRAGKYERARGRLSSWVIGIARNCIIDQIRSRAARREQDGASALAELPEQDQLARVWEDECQRHILQEALRRLRGETRIDAQTLRAFESLALRELEPAEVARQLDMSLNEVYLAKHRCLKRLRPIVTTLASAYATDR
jgi:RNA polymerase sigma factor (sigma-70 family)